MAQRALKQAVKFEELDILEKKLNIIFAEKDNSLFDKYSILVSELAIGSINIKSNIILIAVCNLYIEEFEERRKILSLQLEKILSSCKGFIPLEKIKDKSVLILQRELRKLIESMGSKPQFEYVRSANSRRLDEMERLLNEFDNQKNELYKSIENLINQVGAE